MEFFYDAVSIKESRDAIFTLLFFLKDNAFWSFRWHFQPEVTWANNLAKNEVELGVSLDGDVAWVKNGERLSQFV